MSIHRVTLTALYYGQTCQNVMHFRNDDGTLTDAQICVEIRDQFMTDFKAMSQANCVWNNISSQQRDTGSPPAPANLAVSIAGTQSGTTTAFTPQCYLLRIRTALAGRHNRGRMYVPGPNPSNTVSGLWSSGTVSSWATPIANMISKYNALTGTRGISLGVAPRSSPIDWVGMTTIEFGPAWRNIGIGV